MRRVVLGYELKRDYQRFLQAHNRGRADSDGRPDRTAEEVAAWARQHDLPYFDDHVHFPDARIEYEDVARDPRHEDIEVVTPHYRGAHAAGAARSGFRRYGHDVVQGSPLRSRPRVPRGARHAVCRRCARGLDDVVCERRVGNYVMGDRCDQA